MFTRQAKRYTRHIPLLELYPCLSGLVQTPTSKAIQRVQDSRCKFQVNASGSEVVTVTKVTGVLGHDQSR